MKENYINDKNIWITGASKGIGLEISKELSKFKTNLILSSRDVDKLKETAQLFHNEAKIYAFPLDISDSISIQETFEFIANEVGFPNILINNAGIFEAKAFIDVTVEDFNKIINTNLRGVFEATQLVLPAMLEVGEGTIINIASVAALQNYKYSSIYSASKAALLAMMRCLREEVRNSNIKIINIIPGATATEIWDKKMLDAKKNQMATVKDIADVVMHTLAMCSSNTAMIEDIVIRPQNGDL